MTRKSGVLGLSKNKYLLGLFLGTYSVYRSHCLHFIMVLEEQEGNPDDLQSPLLQRKHALILPAVNLTIEG